MIVDDLIDEGTLRRQQLCWHLQKGVGLNAIADAFHLEAAFRDILKDNFQNHPNQIRLMQIFGEVIYKKLVTN